MSNNCYTFDWPVLPVQGADVMGIWPTPKIVVSRDDRAAQTRVAMREIATTVSARLWTLLMDYPATLEGISRVVHAQDTVDKSYEISSASASATAAEGQVHVFNPSGGRNGVERCRERVSMIDGCLRAGPIKIVWMWRCDWDTATPGQKDALCVNWAIVEDNLQADRRDEGCALLLLHLINELVRWLRARLRINGPGSSDGLASTGEVEDEIFGFRTDYWRDNEVSSEIVGLLWGRGRANDTLEDELARFCTMPPAAMQSILTVARPFKRQHRFQTNTHKAA
ncbi:hypothetical protein HKX48_004301 [Thoreauomyces humboldtii]|nr:hypothetical protein HKX48_004301 [Thoreauomyces humboldtii]